MKEIKTTEAIGHILCHDLTQIIKGVTKDARFRKGHVITEEDIPVLLSMGKEHLFVWENNENILHEDDAAEILRAVCQGPGIHASAPKEGKIELIAQYDGVLKIDLERLDALNDQDEITIATLPQYMPVKSGMKLAGMRVIPLVIAKEKMAHARKTAGDKPLLELCPYHHLKVGVITTGNEVYKGLIEDTFTPVVAAKLQKYGLEIHEHRLTDDNPQHTLTHIRELLQLDMDMIICTGGMSVDPDDRTPAAIKASGAEIVTYGAPVLPGAMFLLAYYQSQSKKVPILGLPGCVMYAATTIFDIVLPRLAAGIPVSRRDIRRLGAGGLCMNCPVCHYPNCSFGK
ncbi:MAG: molybdopterin-binding protein [Selenomonas sp.]|uniref:molybdopterin-binding protein n=1 Tax=Selenomonas sp. TaxID=2053611 RepID=UPI0025D533D3|nr:molybdopterin-binding protein [Selenomonas sp.]MCR5756975.1 molybdopterin-binding protein [Selenomonas sp.]